MVLATISRIHSDSDCIDAHSAVCAELLLLLLQVLVHRHQSPQLIEQPVQQRNI